MNSAQEGATERTFNCLFPCLPRITVRGFAGPPPPEGGVPTREGRKSTFRVVLAILPALLLGAWFPTPAHTDIRSIGIIAAIGDSCMFEHVTDKPFEWIGPTNASFLEISDWGIDDEVTKTIAAVLAPAYRTQSIAIEHQDFDTWTHDSLQRRIHELPVPETPVDAYLLILREWQSDAIGGSDHQLGGLGFYRRDFPGGRHRYGLFASYRLVLMEPDRGVILASRVAVLPNGHLPWLPVSLPLWPRTQNDLTDMQRDTLHADLLKLIGASLPATLRQLGLPTK